MAHVIKLYSKGEISLWIDNDLKHIDLRETCQIGIISRFLEHIIDLNQNTDGPTG